MSFVLLPVNPGRLLQAVAKGTKIINEDGLFSLIKAAPAPAEQPAEAEDESEDDIAFVSATAAPSSAKAELNKLPPKGKASQSGPSRPWPSGTSLNLFYLNLIKIIFKRFVPDVGWHSVMCKLHCKMKHRKSLQNGCFI